MKHKLSSKSLTISFTIFILLLAILMSASAVIAADPGPRPPAISPSLDDTGISTETTATLSAAISSITATESTNACVATFQAGADRLSALQNDDGGWDWPLDDGNPSNSSPSNTIGPIAMGLAHAYLHTGDSNHLSALQQAGTFLLAKTAFSPSDGYLAAMLDQIFGGSTYVQHLQDNFYGPLAAGTYDRNGTLYDTAGYVNLIRTARQGQGIPNLAAWDIGMGLVGAAYAGADTTAWVAGLKAEIDELDGNAVYDVIGLAGSVYGLAFVGENFDPTAGQHAAASSLGDLAAILASYQISGGGFTWNMNYLSPGNETLQETAYALLALNEFDRDGFLSTIQGAANYMVSVQLPTGGWENWAGAGENNEVTGEALWAVSIGITSSLIANPNPVAVNGTVLLTALVENAGLGCNGITAAEYNLYDSDGVLVGNGPMQGSFGAAIVNVSAELTAPGIPGIYDLCVISEDSVGNQSPEECTMLVVYDPSGGFVTGGGWFNSPAGAYMPGPEGLEIVTSANVGDDWFSPDLRGDGYAAFVTGPAAPPLGNGSLEFGTASSTDKAQLFNYDHIGTLLSDIESLSYATYRYSTSTNPAAQYPAINIEVDFVGDGSSYTTLVWEPIYAVGQANLAVDTWQTWDTMAPSQTAFGGGWWSTKGIPGVCEFNCFVSWETILTNNPGAKIKYAVGLNVGSGWDSVFTGAVDALSLTVSGTSTTYDFEVEAPFLPTGKATFGFVSKYKKGESVPTGSTEFVFKTADLNFHSSSYDWLIVTGSNYAKFKGEGTINGEGPYKFQIWAGDNDPDTFRIKIWWEDGDGEHVVYDNGMDQAIEGGNIVVHNK